MAAEPRNREIGAEPPPWWRRGAAELIGAFLLTFVAAGGAMMAAVAPNDVGPAAAAVAPGLVVLALIYAFSHVSGAHFNPAVTLAFVVRGDVARRLVPLYWASQLSGALAAAGLLRWLLFAPVSGASMNPARSLGPAVVGGHLDHLWVHLVGPPVGASWESP